MAAALDPFIPEFDVRERHETTVRAPADLCYDVARSYDMQSIPVIRAIFRLRSALLRSRVSPSSARLDAEALRAMGWGTLAEQPGRFLVAGAVCQPWLPDVVFSPVAPERFAEYREPDRVKIAWTLETEPLGPSLTAFATETRAVATDSRSRARFRRYWRRFGIGIRLIRWLLVPAMRRRAEAIWRGAAASGAGRGLP